MVSLFPGGGKTYRLAFCVFFTNYFGHDRVLTCVLSPRLADLSTFSLKMGVKPQSVKRQHNPFCPIIFCPLCNRICMFFTPAPTVDKNDFVMMCPHFSTLSTGFSTSITKLIAYAV